MLYRCHSSEHVVPCHNGSWANGSVPTVVAGSWCFQSGPPLLSHALVPELFSIFNEIVSSFFTFFTFPFYEGALSQSCFTENWPPMSKPRATVARKNSLADNRKKPLAEPDSEGEPSAAA